MNHKISGILLTLALAITTSGQLLAQAGSTSNENICPETAAFFYAAQKWPESCGEGIPPRYSGAPNRELSAIEGVWDIILHDDGEPTYIVGLLSKGLNHIGYRTEDADWTFRGSWTAPIDTVEVPFLNTLGGTVESVTAGNVIVNVGYTRMVVSPVGGNRMVGEWTSRNKTGRAEWNKRRPTEITEIAFNSNWKDSEGNTVVDVTVGSEEQPGQFEVFHPVTCGAGNMAGNCHAVYLTIYGNLIAGPHEIWVDPVEHMQLDTVRFVFHDGKTFGADASSMSWAIAARAAIVGVQIRLLMRGGAMPGQKVFWFDGKPIPFNLVIHGHPDSVFPEEDVDPYIRDVIVVEDQTKLIYPFNIERRAIKDASTSRRLLIYGDNLHQAKNSGDHPRALDGEITYRNFVTLGIEEDVAKVRELTENTLTFAKKLESPDPALIENLERRLEFLSDTENLVAVEAILIPNTVPGFQTFTIGEARGTWPLIFANQNAKLNFARYGDQVREDSVNVFFPGDIGVVDIIPEADIPFDNIGIRLLRRANDAAEGEEAREVAVLLARRVDDLTADDRIIFRSDSIYFTSDAIPAFQPPAVNGDTSAPDGIALAVSNGDQIGARLFDPSKLVAEPRAVIAEVHRSPEELGELWESALNRVAQCERKTFDGDPLFALQKSKRFSEVAVGELTRYVSPIAFIAGELSGAEKSTLRFNPSVDVYHGDHAAAILIRDEMIELMAAPSLRVPIAALVDNDNQEIQAVRARAIANGVDSEPLIKNGKGVWIGKPFWKQPTLWRSIKSFFDPGGWVSDEHAVAKELPLEETLDIDALAKRFKIPKEEAETWAVQATQGAAKLQLANLEKAIGRAQNAGDCNLDELLVVAGQKSEPAVARIVPRLVKKVPFPGTPPTERWEADKLARGYVERLHLAGAAVRALDQYAAIDDAYKAMAVAALTAGAATVASAGVAALGGSSALSNVVGGAVLLSGDVADLGLFGVKDLDRAIESEEFYDYARGASLVIGDDILIDAETNLESAELAALGLIPAAMGASIGLKDLRYAKNIDNGKALFKQKGADILSDLDATDPEQRTNLMAYLADTVIDARKSGVDALDDTDRALLDAVGGTPFDPEDAIKTQIIEVDGPITLGQTPQKQTQQHQLLRDAFLASDNMGRANKEIFTLMTESGMTPEEVAALAVINGGMPASDILRYSAVRPEALRGAMLKYINEVSPMSPAEARRLVDDLAPDTIETGPPVDLSDAQVKFANVMLKQHGFSAAAAGTAWANKIPPRQLTVDGRISNDELREGLDTFLRDRYQVADAATRRRVVDEWMGVPETPSSFQVMKPASTNIMGVSAGHPLAGKDIVVSTPDAGDITYSAGELLGEGSTSVAFIDRTNPNSVVRINHEVGYEAKGSTRPVEFEDIRRANALEDMGREAIDSVGLDNDYIEPIAVNYRRTLADGRRVESIDMAPGDIAANLLDKRSRAAMTSESRAELEELEKIELGPSMTQQQERRLKILKREQRALRQFEPDEAEAIANAIDELNERGYVVLDGHIHNFSLVRKDGKVKVAFLDPGGIVPVKGRDPSLAAEAQYKVLVRKQEDVEFVRRFGESNPTVYPDARTTIVGEVGDSLDLEAFDEKAAINVDTLSFRPSLGFEHPEVVKAFKALYE